MPLPQVGTPFVGALQPFPHMPQLDTSEAVLTHEPSQFVRLAPQSTPQAPMEQTSPLPHGVPQALQCMAFDCKLTQAPEHSVSPVGQALLHSPPLQVALPPVGGVQPAAQSPQFCGSFETSRHSSPQAL